MRFCIRTELRWFFLVAAVAGVATAPCRLSAEEIDNVIESFKMRRVGDHLSIPVDIGDAQPSFILDTGASGCVFDFSLQRNLVLTFSTARITGDLDTDPIPIWKCRSGFIGRTRIPLNGRGVCLNINGRYGSMGIAGMDFLGRHVIQLDFDSGQIRFLRDAEGLPGERIEIPPDSRLQRMPTMLVELPEIGATEFLIDTGSIGFSDGSLTKAAFDALVSAGKLSVLRGTSRCLRILDVAEERRGMLTELTIGKFRHTNVLVHQGEQNLLGIGYLARYKVTFDFPNRVIILEKAKRFARQCPVNRLGVDFDLSSGIPAFSAVDEDGCAGKLGIRPGELLLTVDGKETRELNLAEIGELIEYAPQGCVLRISDGTPTNARELKIQD